ncbi:hypothetical protein PSTG_17880 [Puccinia striiformis f. sp. tritici PST-78]|uniref:Uncharacterized protein n=1 Tax=Puccinia striiformis f. sp. tritici PST-78 TaxID=1165861 RepID=A0A0L0UNP8_9BASI|nr:hypothetical protein PSTG_17880 [Puccinia striiformis f. sp. tritici PST-78]
MTRVTELINRHCDPPGVADRSDMHNESPADDPLPDNKSPLDDPVPVTETGLSESISDVDRAQEDTKQAADDSLPINESGIIIIPLDVTSYDCHHIILDVGNIAVSSNLMFKDRLEMIKKQNQHYTHGDYAQLESMTCGTNGHSTLNEAKGHEEAHLIERISMSFSVSNCMVDNAPNLTRFKVQGDLPELRVNSSDRKYNIVMSMIDVALPDFQDEMRS